MKTRYHPGRLAVHAWSPYAELLATLLRHAGRDAWTHGRDSAHAWRVILVPRINSREFRGAGGLYVAAAPVANALDLIIKGCAFGDGAAPRQSAVTAWVDALARDPDLNAAVRAALALLDTGADGAPRYHAMLGVLGYAPGDYFHAARR